jgi:DNA/RNA endonuclease YhcR with UshA esterase domain
VPSNRSKSARISAAEAKDHYNESLVVTGRVTQVTFRPTIAYLNLDKAYPDTPFAIAIFSAATNQFGDLSRLKGKAVEVQGKIVEYRGRPEIVIDNTNQLVVLDQ